VTNRFTFILLFLVLGVYLTPVYSLHICLGEQAGHHHGNCDSGMMNHPPLDKFKAPHDDCFSFQKEVAHATTSAFAFIKDQRNQQETPAALATLQLLALEVVPVSTFPQTRHYTNTDPPWEKCIPARGPPSFC